MKQPVALTFRHLSPTPSILNAIEEKAAHLLAVAPRVKNFRVLVDVPHHHHHRGFAYHVAITGRIRSRAFRVSSDRTANLYTAIRQAFDVAIQKLDKERERFRSLHRTSEKRAPRLEQQPQSEWND